MTMLLVSFSLFILIIWKLISAASRCPKSSSEQKRKKDYEELVDW